MRPRRLMRVDCRLGPRGARSRSGAERTGRAVRGLPSRARHGQLEGQRVLALRTRRRRRGLPALSASAGARLRGLRGSRWDVFGYTAERKQERELIKDYEATVARVLGKLSVANVDLAAEIAAIPEHIRGYGHVKEHHIEEAKAREAELLSAYEAGRTSAPAALAAE